MLSKYNVVIVGGGMVGNAMACALASHKVFSNKSVLLLEAAPKPPKAWEPTMDYSNRVSALSPSSQKILTQIGAWKHIENGRYGPVKKMQVWEDKSSAAISFSSEPGKALSNIVENDLTVSSLNKCLDDFKDRIHVQYGARLEDCELPEQDSSAVALKLASGETIETDLVIGADGARSFIRQKMGSQYIQKDYDQNGVVATLELAEPQENTTAWQRFLTTGPIAILPLSKRLSSLVWTVPRDHAKDYVAMNENLFLDSLHNALRQEPSTPSTLNKVLGLLDSTKKLHPPQMKSVRNRASFPLGLGHSVRYVGHSVALIGDAAHRVHPLAGQGVNLGFGDVESLLKQLVSGLRDGRALGNYSDLCRYESDRQLHNLPTMMTCDALQMLYGTDFFPVVAARSVGLNLFNAVPQVKDFIVSRASQ